MSASSKPESGAAALPLEKVYAELRAGIRETDSISFRLLGLVPLVSGTALIVLVLGKEALPPPLMTLLSLFAAAITLGLLRWELRNVQTCSWLIAYAEDVEKAALAARDMTEVFRPRPAAPQRIGKTEAEKFIYWATIVTWVALPPVAGAVSLQPNAGALVYVVMAGLIFVGAIASLFANPRVHPLSTSTHLYLPEQAMRDLRLCFIGESFINGTNDPEFRGWVGRVCGAAARANLRLTAYNLGVRGPTSRELAAFWEDEVARRLKHAAPYDKGIVFSFGVGDTVVDPDTRQPAVAPVESEANARAILEAAVRTQYPVLMIGPPPVAEAGRIPAGSRVDPQSNDRIEDLSRRFAAVCASQGVPYLDVFAALRASRDWMDEVALTDGFHPGSGGYAHFARLVQDWPAWLKLTRP